MTTNKKSVLFICLGNKCRSPIAEAVFIKLLRDKGIQDKWEVDSAAIGNRHCGGAPDHRVMLTLKAHNISYKHTIKQICQKDFNYFDFILGMDNNNMKDLEDLSPKNCKSKCLLLGSFDPDRERIIKDPYFDNDHKGFEKCYQQCIRSCEVFLTKEA